MNPIGYLLLGILIGAGLVIGLGYYGLPWISRKHLVNHVKGWFK